MRTRFERAHADIHTYIHKYTDENICMTYDSAEYFAKNNVALPGRQVQWQTLKKNGEKKFINTKNPKKQQQ